MTTVTRKRLLYKFDQLGPKGKARAIEQYRDDSREWDDCGDLSELLANDLSDHHGVTNCELSYSLGYCQGDGVAFSGNPDIDHWAEHDEHLNTMLIELHAWAVLCGEEEPQLSVKIENNDRYCHSSSMSLEITNDADWRDVDYDNPLWTKQDSIEEYLTAAIKDISRALEKTGYAEIEYRDSDEYIAEYLGDSSHEFTRSGERL